MKKYKLLSLDEYNDYVKWKETINTDSSNITTDQQERQDNNLVSDSSDNLVNDSSDKAIETNTLTNKNLEKTDIYSDTVTDQITKDFKSDDSDTSIII